jgi:hypothetical protein
MAAVESCDYFAVYYELVKTFSQRAEHLNNDARLHDTRLEIGKLEQKEAKATKACRANRR